MRKQKHIQISIPQPCTQDWNKMTPQEQGRFCDSCQKCVVDFTGFNDEQLYRFFAEHKGQKVCGRMKKTQLNRAITLPPQPHSSLYKWVIAAGLALVFVATPETGAFAQVPYTQEQAYIDSNNTSNHTNDTFSIKGVVVDENNEPVINAIVKAVQDGVIKGKTVTDFDGNFIIENLQQGEYALTVNYIGYEEVQIQVVSDTSITNMIIEMKPSNNFDDLEIIMGLVPFDNYVDTIPKVKIKKKPLIDKFEGGHSKTIYSDDIENSPLR